MRILIVDDNEDGRDIAEATLLSAGYSDLYTAASAWEALKILDIGRTTDVPPNVDLILLDIVMPEMDGIEACARIRNDARHVDVPIIMVTSLDDMDSLGNAFVAGATDYVTKPINRVELSARVRAALKLKAEFDRRKAREVELLLLLSTAGSRRGAGWIDEATGLLAGEVAEAYLAAATKHPTDDVMSILAVALDRFDLYRATYGEDATQNVLAEVANAVRTLTATIGIVAAAYRNGMIVVVAPNTGANSARQLGEALCSTVSKLRLPNSESIVSNHMTASVAAVTGRTKRSNDCVQLLSQALSRVKDATSAGGNRVLALTI
jgi:phosphoserine phosphatase RsbU/P